MKKKYNHTVVAGTFDRLHAGHKHLLKTSLRHAKKMSCGVTSDLFVKNSKKPLKKIVQPLPTRLDTIRSALPKSVAYFTLNNSFGPALSSKKFDSIAVTRQTLKKALVINKMRQKRLLPPLKPVLVDILACADQKALSSTRIRLGEVNRSGLVYLKNLTNKTKVLPEESKKQFKKPFGKIISPKATNLDWQAVKILKRVRTTSPTRVVTVGDLTTQVFVKNNIPFNLGIIDGMVNRQPVGTAWLDANYKEATNPAGTIHKSLVLELKAWKSESFYPPIIKVNGEEDLAVLPLVLISPLKTLIYYGQPNQGLVELEVSEKSKSRALKLLSLFKG